MEFSELLQIVGDEPVFESAAFLAGEANPANVRLQLSRWTAAGRIYQLRRGLYALPPPYQKVKPHPFRVANHLSPGSYVSGLSALAHYNLIPEAVYATTSVTSRRPARWETALGWYEFKHLQPRLLYALRKYSPSRWTSMGSVTGCAPTWLAWHMRPSPPLGRSPTEPLFREAPPV